MTKCSTCICCDYTGIAMNKCPRTQASEYERDIAVEDLPCYTEIPPVHPEPAKYSNDFMMQCQEAESILEDLDHYINR